MRANPLIRSYRVDKLTLAALEATLAIYRDPRRALTEIPVLAMLTATRADVGARAEWLRDKIDSRGLRMSVVDTDASVGGGAFPTARIPSAALAVDGPAERLERELRSGQPPVVGRVTEGRVLLDPRTVPQFEDAAFARAVADAIERAVA
jgi:L-seryl-tRNA(Ser) seleniumtransferase